MRFRFFTFSGVYDYLELAPALVLCVPIVILISVAGIFPSNDSLEGYLMLYFFMYFLIFVIIYISFNFFKRFRKVKYNKKLEDNIDNEKYVKNEIKNNSTVFHSYLKNCIFNGKFINFVNITDSRYTGSFGRNSDAINGFRGLVFSKHRGFRCSRPLIGGYSIIVVNLNDIEFVDSIYDNSLKELIIKFKNNDYLYHFYRYSEEYNYLIGLYDYLKDNCDKYNYQM